MNAPHISRDAALRARAAKVMPGGPGHVAVTHTSPRYPQFFERAEGGHVWDVDGREYVDLMMSWGPIVLGHHHPAVDEAVARQAALGDCMGAPGAVMVELAEKLVARIPHADWAMFQKNGSDATTACVTIARAGTKRRKVLAARGSYHGSVPWCSPSVVGVTEEDRAHVVRFDYNDVDSLREAAASVKGDLAAVIVTGFRHDNVRDQEMPASEFARAARALCDAEDAALIVDDVRAGLRIHPGGTWETVGVRPDLSAWSKAIANGHALAAVTGNDRFRKAASEIFVTGSFWYASVSMAAAIATLDALEREDAIAHMVKLGTRLRAGLDAAARRHGVGLRQTGPVQMPLFLFDDDPDFRKGRAFCEAALAEGAFLHPRHNMFLCAMHTEADMDRVIAAGEAGCKAVAALA